MIDRELRVVSSKSWLDFTGNPHYLDLVDELNDRREGLVSDLVRGEDPNVNTDGELRKRIQELDWILSLVASIVEECEAAEKSRLEPKEETNKENEDEDHENE